MRFLGMKREWTIAVIGCMLAVIWSDGAGAQTSKSTAAKSTPSKAGSAKVPDGPSTLSGVYTAEQASRGKDVYFGSCRMCHTPASHTGETFAKWWRGKQLSDLFVFVSTRMPKNDPGSLAVEDVADVMAYLLKMNAMPVGPNELVADVDSLKKVRIEVKRSGATTTAKRAKP
jgi:mono/diheme cytochrome c family protein